MPVTTIDPAVALIVVDMQKGLRGMPFLHPFDEVLARTQALVAGFRKAGQPVVLVNVAGSAPGRTERAPSVRTMPDGWTDLLDELDRQPEDILITKRTWGAFTHTRLEERLRGAAVTQVVLAGIATGTGVESTARQAYEAGFHVTLAIDAMTDGRPDAHAHSLAHVFPRLGETGTTEDILTLLQERK